MPRPINPAVEEKILHAARKLWHKGGEDALNMRAVAKAAGTNTPAVYRRFRNRDALLSGLVSCYQQEVLMVLQRCHSIEDLGRAYMDYVLSHPREYLLMNSGVLGRVSKGRPNLDFLIAKSSEWLGGGLGEHAPLVFALWALAHGTAMLRIAGSVRDEDYPKMHAAYAEAVKILVANEKKLRT